MAEFLHSYFYVLAMLFQNQENTVYFRLGNPMNTSSRKYKDIDAYIHSFDGEVKNRLITIREIVKKVAPNAEETIKYGMPTILLNGHLVYFAAYKQHIAVYPATTAMIKAHKELKKYKTGKGTFQFHLDEPLPIDLIRTIVHFRAKENNI